MRLPHFAKNAHAARKWFETWREFLPRGAYVDGAVVRALAYELLPPAPPDSPPRPRPPGRTVDTVLEPPPPPRREEKPWEPAGTVRLELLLWRAGKEYVRVELIDAEELFIYEACVQRFWDHPKAPYALLHAWVARSDTPMPVGANYLADLRIPRRAPHTLILV